MLDRCLKIIFKIEGYESPKDARSHSAYCIFGVTKSLNLISGRSQPCFFYLLQGLNTLSYIEYHHFHSVCSLKSHPFIKVVRHWEDYRKLREEIKLIQRDKAVFLFTARLLYVMLSTRWLFWMINLIVTTIYLWSFYVFFQFFFSSWNPLARRNGLQKIKVKM